MHPLMCTPSPAYHIHTHTCSGPASQYIHTASTMNDQSHLCKDLQACRIKAHETKSESGKTATQEEKDTHHAELHGQIAQIELWMLIHVY